MRGSDVRTHLWNSARLLGFKSQGQVHEFYLCIHLFIWCLVWDMDKKLKHQFIRRPHPGARLKFEPLNIPTPSATEITSHHRASQTKEALSSPMDQGVKRQSWEYLHHSKHHSQHPKPKQKQLARAKQMQKSALGTPWWVAKFGFWQFALWELRNS